MFYLSGLLFKLSSYGKHDNEPNAVYVTEIWDSKEDHDNSLNVRGVRELIMRAMPILDGQPQKGQELEILGGAGVQYLFIIEVQFFMPVHSQPFHT